MSYTTCFKNKGGLCTMRQLCCIHRDIGLVTCDLYYQLIARPFCVKEVQGTNVGSVIIAAPEFSTDNK